MTHYELEQGLNALYRDLDNIQNMDEATARRVYNVDCKADIIEVIQKENTVLISLDMQVDRKSVV